LITIALISSLGLNVISLVHVFSTPAEEPVESVLKEEVRWTLMASIGDGFIGARPGLNIGIGILAWSMHYMSHPLLRLRLDLSPSLLPYDPPPFYNVTLRLMFYKNGTSISAFWCEATKSVEFFSRQFLYIEGQDPPRRNGTTDPYYQLTCRIMMIDQPSDTQFHVESAAVDYIDLV